MNSNNENEPINPTLNKAGVSGWVNSADKLKTNKRTNCPSAIISLNHLRAEEKKLKQIAYNVK